MRDLRRGILALEVSCVALTAAGSVRVVLALRKQPKGGGGCAEPWPCYVASMASCRALLPRGMARLSLVLGGVLLDLPRNLAAKI